MGSRSHDLILTRPPGAQLLGRQREREVLGRLLDAARGGDGGVLIVHGEPGVGKTALLDWTVEEGRRVRILRTVGVEGEMELPFAALQQLCSPVLELAAGLPDPQRDALGVAFGLSAGQAPSPFLVGLAALGLLSEASQERPLLCVVDDAQWLDRASARSLAFVARRLLAEKIALVFAARELGSALVGLPELRVEALGHRDARTLLESVLPARLDEHVLDRIVLETRGNPLALLELPRGLTPIQLAGGFGLPPAVPLSASIEESFTRRLDRLPGDARRLLLIAAADPTGNPAVVWRAAQQLEIPESIAESVEAEDLLEIGIRVVFRHPLVRSAVYRAAGLTERRAVHRALAGATDPQVDPDRHAWHRAQAASMPDEDIAEELERSAGRAQACGGLAAVAVFLERAAALTPEPAHRARRLLAAAAANRDAGALEAALQLLAGTEDGPLDELGRARAELLRGQIALEQRRGSEAGRLFLSAAGRLEPLDPELARETYLEALAGAMSSDVEVAGGAPAVAEAARAAPTGSVPARAVDVLLDAFAIRLTEGYAAAAPALLRALDVLLAMDVSSDDVGHRLSLSSSRNGNVVALELWDDDALHQMAARQVQVARDAGALVHLQFALSFVARSHMLAGDLAAATLAIDETRSLAEATGNPAPVNAPMILAAWRGREPQASELIQATSDEAAAQRWTSNNYARAVLYNGLGRHEAARDAAWEAFQPDPIGYGSLLVGELAEAASRTADRVLLEAALDWLSERTGAISSDWAIGIEARVRALLSEGESADSSYRTSITYLACTRVRLELARTHLLYGEWLRRERRRRDAREQLRTALDMFGAMGTEAFAARAERELLATGERARKRTADTLDQLTPQEEQVARLAAKGATNREIATQLFITQSTVEYHLRKAFRKLDVKSRTQLAHRIS
ncbi:MAG TPA: LuxR C-terminal-related transcriptional regulator [Solirubrobacteraceae bacterium]|jgi:DNA-binding CsgD family transcriptional regulator|nr:LuxR C-terminal-related transcriptional regulator [Solirubrobacteraceae bacterium]